VRLDRNKTDDPRAWALDAGIAEALRTYKKHFRAEAEPTDLVFQDAQGRPHTKFGAAELLRGHVKAIGLETERPELSESTAQRKRIRVHDLRGTFVTVSLANGKSESWISDRTGHHSSAMIKKYKRVARSIPRTRRRHTDAARRRVARTSGSDRWALRRGPGQNLAQRSDSQQKTQRPQGDSNPCYSLERAVSWAGLDDGDLKQGRGKIV
jgi:Phage integrase family